MTSRHNVGSHLSTAVWVVAFVACIVGANWAILHVGVDNGAGHPRTIPIGFGWTAPSGVIFAGAQFTLRDIIHDRMGSTATLVLIVVSAPLTVIAASPAVAVASAVTFLVAEVLDLGVYRRLRRRGLIAAALGSNLASTIVDSILFLSLAFGVSQAFSGSVGMSIGKLEASVLTLAAVTAMARFTVSVTHRRRPALIAI